MQRAMIAGKEVRPTMYGTIARLRPKPERLADLVAYGRRISGLRVPGYRASYLFSPAVNPYPEETAFLVAIFDDEESYRANADSPEQNERYLELREMLLADPDWMDGTFASG